MQQLSKQDHYDFGLRALVSVLKYAGKKRRAQPDVSDEEVKNFYISLIFYFTKIAGSAASYYEHEHG